MSSYVGFLSFCILHDLRNVFSAQ